MSFPFLSSVAAVTAVDLSPQMLARARRRAHRLGRDIDLRQMSALALDLPDGSFDTVTTAMSTCTFPDPGRGVARDGTGGPPRWAHPAAGARPQPRRLDRPVPGPPGRSAVPGDGLPVEQDVVSIVADAGLTVEDMRTRTWGVITALVALPTASDGR